MNKLQSIIVLLIIVSCNKTPQTVAEVLERNLSETSINDSWEKLKVKQIEAEVVIEINGDRVGKAIEKVTIRLPFEHKTENFENEELTHIVLYNSESKNKFIKFEKGEVTGVTSLEPFKIDIKIELDLLKKASKLKLEKTLWRDNKVFKISDTIEHMEYMYHRESFLLLAKTQITPYGKTTFTYEDYQNVEGYKLAQIETREIPKASYKMIKQATKISLNTKLKGDFFAFNKKWKNNLIGTKFPDFEFLTFGNDSKYVKNEDFKDKVFLIDFWATWCKPCIAEFPNIEKIYKEFKPYGFEVLSVSLDQREKDLKQFMLKNKLIWTNVLHKEGFNSELAKKLRIASIPKPILVNEKGIIIAMDADATGESLNEHLNKIFIQKRE